MGIGVAFEFLCIFWSSMRPMALENSSHLIEYPYLGITMYISNYSTLSKV